MRDLISRSELDSFLRSTYPDQYGEDLQKAVDLFPVAELPDRLPDWFPTAHKSLRCWLRYLGKHYYAEMAALSFASMILSMFLYLAVKILLGVSLWS